MQQPTADNPQVQTFEEEQSQFSSIPENLQTIFSSERAFITKTSTKICQTIVQIQATRKLYHIRQNFRRLALQILKLDNAEFYVFHDSGHIEYHDFKENFITQLLEQDEKRKTIQHILASTALAVENVDIQGLMKSQKSLQTDKSISTSQKSHKKTCQQFTKLFNIPQHLPTTTHLLGQINKQNDKHSILSLFTFPSTSNCSFQNVRTPPAISDKIIQKLVLISMIQIEEETEYDIVRFYSKELLDILGLVIGESEGKIRRGLLAASEETKTVEERVGLNQMVRTVFAGQQKQYLTLESLKYQEFRYELLERVRMYSKYLCEDNVMLLDFDEQGRLFFVSNNRKNTQLTPLLNKLSLTNNLCIEKIFQDNVNLQQHIRRSLEGQSKNKKLYEIENGIKARVVRSEDNEIERIMIVVEDPPQISSHGSFSSSTLEGMSSTNKKKKGSCNSDSISLGKDKKGSGSLLKSIEKDNPGITQNGWLNLFIKDHQLKRNTPSSVMSKKKRTLFARSSQQDPASTHSLTSPSSSSFQHLHSLDIYSPSTNLLQLQPSSLEPFIKKVFSELKFFKALEHNKEYFDNFLFHLHEGYSIHDNPFHNFMHGVNVMHTCFLICCGVEANQVILSPQKVFSTVLSGLCHDVGHTGRTNSFEIASRSKKALTYNDLSPLQNFHASFTFQILRKPQNNFLQKLTPQEYSQIRKDIISNILYTDIKEHFPLIKRFKQITYDPQQGKLLTPQDLRTLTGMITHTSDFGGSAKEFSICRQWSRRVNIEFTAQYKQQELLGLPQTPFFKDLQVETIMAKNQMGFLKVIVFPLYEALDGFYKGQGVLGKLKEFAEGNVGRWGDVQLGRVVEGGEGDIAKEDQEKNELKKEN